MYFVGREKESRQIIKALERGENVILTGKYGIGKTSLIRQVAGITKDRWRFIFVDFSRTPGRVCQQLMAELPFTEEVHRIAGDNGYKSRRFRIVNLALKDRGQPVLVLDDIAKLSSPKLDLIRHLTRADRFRCIAIVETFLGEKDLFRLRAWLSPVLLIKIPHLSRKSAREFFCHFSRPHHFHWTEDQINSLAEMSGGYPLGMKEVVTRKLASSGNLGDPAPLPKSNGRRPNTSLVG